MQKHKPFFFKIMHGDFRDQLRLPPGFAKHLNEPLPINKVLLETSTRIRWIVNLKKVANKLVFTEGWEGFVGENCIEFGDLLVFRLLGNSKLYVKIYGRSGCEKERDMCNLQPAVKFKCHKGLIAFAGECSTARNNKERSRKQRVAQRYSCWIAGMKWRRDPLEKERALEAASEFQSDYPCFLSKLCSSHINRKSSYFRLPVVFARKYLPQVLIDIWIVDSTGRRSWQVKFSYLTNNAYLCRGWNTVVWGNYLRGGSLCVFELIDSKDIKLKLTLLNVVR